MATITIRIDKRLKARMAAAAERAGKPVHAFIREAITEMVKRTESDAAFDQVADARWAKAITSGNTVAWEAARTYLQSRAAGRRARRPAARRIDG